MKLALLGRNLSHSYSIKLWNELWHKKGVKGHFQIIDTDDISNIRISVKELDLDGFTVTIPYKEDIIPLLDVISPEAKAAGAVNAVQIKGNKFYGYNTDIYGYIALLQYAVQSTKNRVLICGYGGAAKAVEYAHQQLGHNITVASRRPIEGKVTISYSDLEKKGLGEFDIIVNTTPLGMYPNTETFPPLPYTTIAKGSVAIDLVYNPSETAFMKLCTDNGASAHNGLLMLEKQAESFYNILKTL